MFSTRALVLATIIGTILQFAMVITGHSNPAIAAQFAVVGMAISLMTGVVYAKLAGSRTIGGLAAGGFVSGGLCALIGIAVSYYLGDVSAMILALGTLSSAVAGAIGGALGKIVFGGGRVAA
jgi:hypothetical protein